MLVVDDDPLVLDALKLIIDRDERLTWLDGVRDGHAALSAARAKRPDVVVMDLHLGGGPDGVATTRRLMSSLNPPRVLAITSFDTDAYLAGALEAGAVGFLLKSDVHDHLVRAIHMAEAGDPMISPDMTRRLIASYVRPTADPAQLAARERTAALTPREVEVAGLIGQGLTYEAIAARLFISPHTVKAVIRSALPKVDARTGAQLAVLVATARLDLH